MPFLVLLLLALAGGTLSAFLASRYPTPVIGQEPSEAASEMLAEETVEAAVAAAYRSPVGSTRRQRRGSP